MKEHSFFVFYFIVDCRVLCNSINNNNKQNVYIIHKKETVTDHNIMPSNPQQTIYSSFRRLHLHFIFIHNCRSFKVLLIS